MSGFEIAGLLLGVYPIVLGAINVYKATKSGRAAAVLIRRLKTEEVVYRQFVQKLLISNVSQEQVQKLLDRKSPDMKSWKDSTLNRKLGDRLGSDKADLILEILREMDKLLKDLNTEFSNIGRGIEILGKLRSGYRVAKCSMPQSSVQLQLTQLTILNGDLSRLLDGPQMASFSIVEDESQPARFLLRDWHEAVELYEVIRQGYNCDCMKPHITNFGLRCSEHTSLPVQKLDVESNKWEFELLVPQRTDQELNGSATTTPESEKAEIDDESNERKSRTHTSRRSSPETLEPRSAKRSRSISITELPCRLPTKDRERSFIRDLCSFVEKVDFDKAAPDDCEGIIGKNKKYKLCINQAHHKNSKNIVCLEDLLGPNYPLLRKDRMQLALRLSSSILQFCLTPWVDNSWTSKDFCVLSVEEEQHNEFLQLFVTRSFYSSRVAAKIEQASEAVDNLWSWYDEPILTKLGFALIELALGHTLPELRREYPSANIDTTTDTDFLNFQTANMILNSGRIAREESKGYEDVVRACIKHQYPSINGSGVKGLDSGSDSFFDNAEESIIGPLYAECAKSWGTSWGQCEVVCER